MATKRTKKASFSDEQNEQPPVPVENVEEAQIVEGDENEPKNALVPSSRSISPVKGFAMPLANVEDIKNASEKYQSFLNALLDENDIQKIENKDPKTGKPMVKLSAKKSGFGKIARFWGVSTEIIKSFFETQEIKKDITRYNKWQNRYEIVYKAGDTYVLAKAWCKAILPNGQFAVRGAACSEIERNFAHIPHDLLATAETRASKRAIEAVIGMGEIEVEEDESESESIQEQPKSVQNNYFGLFLKSTQEQEPPPGWEKPFNAPPKAQNAPQPMPQEENVEYQPYEVNGTKYCRKIVNGKVFQEGLDPLEWKPMYKIPFNVATPNWKLAASDKQKEFIGVALQKAGIGKEDDPHIGIDDIVFYLQNRIDGSTQEKLIQDFDRGDAYDVIETIKNFGKEGLLKLLEVKE